MSSEFKLIRKYFARPAPGAALGVGDDAALLRPGAGLELAVSTDLLLEGRHFRAGAEPRALGHKALAVNLSDMAAMGAAPRWALLAISLPSADEPWLAAFAEGFFALAARFGVELVGGDTTRGPLSVCVTILGEVPTGRALLRSGAAPGDDVWVSGELGGAALALSRPDIAAAAQRLAQPEPRVALGTRLRGVASAAIDVSDGFAQDLGHILESSGVGATVEYECMPKCAAFGELGDRKLESRCVLSGGDDYELVFTAPRDRRAALEQLAGELGLALARVGAIEKGNARLRIVDRNRKPMRVARGFDHFAP
ncbi:MAG: thiamine-phosphate kinase [Betaproteobacteria bacterium]|nr:thiamine-phosphate kinase [Betaproteobacteria bacterium]